MSRRGDRRSGGRGSGGSGVGILAVDPLTLSPIAAYRQTINVGASITWVDLTGNGNDLSNLVALGPTKNASDSNFNGQPSLSFNGLQGLLTAGNLTLGTTNVVEVFTTGFISGGATNRILSELSVNVTAANGAWFIGYNWTTPTGTGYSGLIHGNVANTWMSTNAPSGFGVIHTCFDMGVTGTDVDEIRFNNVLQAVTGNSGLNDNTGNYGSFPYFFGARSSLVNPVTGSFASHYVFNRRLTPGQRGSIVAFERARFGI